MTENLLILAGGIAIGGIALLTIVNSASRTAIGGCFGW